MSKKASPVPQKFNTFNTFAIFAKFAKFANFDPVLEHPTLIHRHPPRLRSISEHAVRTPTPSPVFDGPGTREAGGGQGVRAKAEGLIWLSSLTSFSAAATAQRCLP